MSTVVSAEARLAGRRSFSLLLLLLVATLSTVFGGEVLIMHLLDRLLPAEVGKWPRSLLNAGLLSLLVVAVILPFMMHLRTLHLRQARNSLRLQYTLDHHAIVSITDVTGRITFANDRFCEISGYARDELLGRNHRILKSGEHPDAFYRDMWSTLVQGSIWHGDVCNRAKDGRFYWVRATITPFFNEKGKPEEYIAIRTDITAQKRLEAASREQETRFRTILDNLGEGVYTLDAEGKVAYLNKEAERLLGWKLEDLRGLPLHETIHHHYPDGRPMPADRCPIRHAIDECRGFRSGDEVFFRKDGSMLPVKINGVPLVVEGARLGSVAVFSDASEEHLLQQRLLDAKNAAEEAVRLKSDFLSTMSHEIRTPLNGVIGMTDLLMDTPLDAEQTEFAQLIKVSADALMGIVSDILDFSKIEAGRLEIEVTDFSLRQTVEGALDVLAGKTAEKDLLLASFIAPDLPDHLLGDPTRIGQILLNFLSNAIKFTDRGRVTVAVRSATDLQAAAGRAAIRFSVQDTGIGLSETQRAGLFRPFVQTDSSTTRKYGGTGLGLSICKRLAEAMGGRVGVDSEPGKGSCFWVELLLEVAEEKRHSRPPAEILGGKRIILAGDGDGAAGIWKDYFAAWEVDCEAVASLPQLETCIAGAVAEQAPYDLILLADPLIDCGLGDAVRALQSGVDMSSLVCCLPRSDREFRAEFGAFGLRLVSGPLRQSRLLQGLIGALSGDMPTQARRVEDVEVIARSVPASGNGQRLLLAEDNGVNQRVAVQMLERLGYTVDVVSNGKQAVAAVASGIYQLVLMDCQMPEMDGFSATMAIRRAEADQGRRLPVIALTANALQGDRERCVAAGMDDYLSKPIDAAQLAETLAHWLARTAARPGGDAAVASADAKAGGGDRPVIDIARLEEIFGDDDEAIDELLAELGEALRSMRERLDVAIADRGGLALELAHELRGLAKNVGAGPLAELADELEQRAARGDRAGFAAQVPEVVRECQRTIQFIAGRPQRQKA